MGHTAAARRCRPFDLRRSRQPSQASDPQGWIETRQPHGGEQEEQRAGRGKQHDESPGDHARPPERVGRPRAAPACKQAEKRQGAAESEGRRYRHGVCLRLAALLIHRNGRATPDAVALKGDAIRMSVGAPWSVKGIDPKAREVAKDLARRSGMTLGEWLNRVILEDDLPEELTAETQFSDRLHRASHGAPRLSVVPTSPDLARVAFALDRVTDRIEASETRTGLAINGVEHSVRQALARVETAEREQHAATYRIEARLAEAATQQGLIEDRLRRVESDPGGPRSDEALRLMESRLAKADPDQMAESVLERLGDRLSQAETRTSMALEDLKGALAAFDHRLASVENGGVHAADPAFAALGDDLTRRIEAVRSEVTEKLEAAAGPAFEVRFAAMAETVREAERRSTQAVEDIGRQVLSMAEAVSRKLGEVDQRSADAIDQVGTEVARIAGAVELRLARGEHVQAEAFERLGAELSRVTATLADQSQASQAPEA
eukprot:gene16522-34439_t